MRIFITVSLVAQLDTVVHVGIHIVRYTAYFLRVTEPETPLYRSYGVWRRIRVQSGLPKDFLTAPLDFIDNPRQHM